MSNGTIVGSMASGRQDTSQSRLQKAHRWHRRPLPLLLLVVALLTFLIQAGELGTSDSTHRLQVAHALWTGQPQMAPGDFPDAGAYGRGGRLYATWGIGQSLLLLPSDLAGSALAHLPMWRNYVASQADPTVRDIVVSFTTNILVNVLSALAAWRLLGLLGFTEAESSAGVLALICATTHLHYAQNMMENNYVLLLTMAGFAGQYRWLRTGAQRPLVLGSLALGLNLLTRLTTALDIEACTLFLLLAAWWSRGQGEPPVLTRAKIRMWCCTALPAYAGFFALDRVYQWVRFGSWTTTYLGAFARQRRHLDPSLPATFPFNGHAFAGGLHAGVWGPLFSPGKSIFLFDPLLIAAIVLTVVLWRRLPAGQRAFVVASLVLVILYIGFYARYLWWAGDFAWGDRYVSSAVEFATLLAVPLLVRHRAALGRGMVSAITTVTVISCVVQCASLAFWLPLEIYQGQDFLETHPGSPVFVIWLRFRNIAARLLHRQAAWGLNTHSMFEDPWDAAHITTWNFLPSLLRHIGQAPLWAVDVLYGVWALVAVALVWTTIGLGQTFLPKKRRGEADGLAARS